jgi:alkanesulfonate monooxygenase SsuD/methylene tetrahydromethanopterin reductase-like flavin-dependent oxidoreductase (luciferase family)
MQKAIQVRGSYDFVHESAMWAEANGLDAIALPDHYLQRGDDPDLAGYDHLVHLAGLARETSTIELVSLLSPVTFRHPAVMYKMGVTLDEMSVGRFTLGVGTGWLEEEFTLYGLPYPERAQRFELLEEAMGYLRNAITPGSHPFGGPNFELGEFDPHPHPENLRLLIGGGGETKTPRLAGRFADEFNIYACPPSDYARKRQTAIDAANESGRNGEDLLFSTAAPAIFAKKEADYRERLESFAGITGSTAERIEEVYRDRGYPHGFGSQPSEMLAALEDAGCQRYYAQAFGAKTSEYDMMFEAISA